MQEEQKKFQEKLAELLAFAKEKENEVSLSEVRKFFESWKLSENQLEMVCEYLIAHEVEVEGFQPGMMSDPEQEKNRKEEFSEEELRALEQYEKELGQGTSHSEEECEALYQRAAGGDDLAKSALIQAFLPRIISIAKELHTPDVFLMDLIQEGNVSLLVALNEPEECADGVHFLEQAITTGIREFLEEHREQKHRDHTVVDKVNRLRDAIEELSDGEELNFSVEELSAYLDLSVEEIEDILRIAGEEP